MNRSAATLHARKLMEGFARRTGLDPPAPRPRRYLWTDAFAVCNYFALFYETGDPAFRELAIGLIGQVHHTLGRFRDDDTRAGWISGLPPGEAELHPVAGGLRIGKDLPERSAGEPFDEDREWDRDGQYYHYLTKWMHALGLASRVTGDRVYLGWAVELARAAHKGFTYRTGGRKKMYWKMSTDLSRPLVTSMGQHDPLDGLVTYATLQRDEKIRSGQAVLKNEIDDIAGMVRHLPLVTDDPLGIGGLLSDAARIARLADRDGPLDPGLLEQVVSAALAGLERFGQSPCLGIPADYRLAFRELGLATGLAATGDLPEVIRGKPGLFGNDGALIRGAGTLVKFISYKKTIEEFWLDENNQASRTWRDHQEINTVMLATCLVPWGFLDVRDTRKNPADTDSAR